MIILGSVVKVKYLKMCLIVQKVDYFFFLFMIEGVHIFLMATYGV